MWTNGKDELKDERRLIQELWRQMCLTEDEQDPGTMLVENAFINYVNETFSPWEVLMYCSPLREMSGCGAEEFFWDWLGDLGHERLKEIAGLAGWREIDG